MNLEDMERAGALLMDSAAFAAYGPETVPDLSAAIREEMLASDAFPEPFAAQGDAVGWTDLWLRPRAEF